MKRFLLAVVVTLACGPLLRGDSAEDWEKMRRIVPRGYVCARANGSVTVDGKLDDRAWKAARWSGTFLDIEGSAKPIPRFRTRMKMCWDDQYLYVAARMEEPHVWGTLTDHDSVIFHDNDFEVFIDPDGDNHEYYEFEMNALNTGWDLFLPKPYKDHGSADNGWEIPGLKTAVHVVGTLNNPSDRDSLWSVEIAIPWSSMARTDRPAVAPAVGDRWRVNFSRVQWKHVIVEGKYQKVPKVREDNWVWSPQGIIDMHRPERWGYVLFAERTGSTARVVPRAENRLRDALMTIYHRQKGHHQKHGDWATDLASLGLHESDFRAFPGGVRMTNQQDGYTAELQVPVGRGRVLRGTVRHDSLLQVSHERDGREK